jgi:hypothetical protein
MQARFASAPATRLEWKLLGDGCLAVYFKFHILPRMLRKSGLKVLLMYFQGE